MCICRDDWRRPANADTVSGVCGRFTQQFSWSRVHAFLNLLGPASNLRPRYNVAPTQTVAAVRVAHGERRLSMLRWGLVPSWARDPSIGSRLINARLETAATKPAFRAAWKARRRCLIPADGFYEWTGPRARRQPWLIAMEDGALFAMAGLWERWGVREDAVLRGPPSELAPGDALETFTILTTEATAAVAPVHHRMPVIVPPHRIHAWLSGEDMVLDPWPESMRVQPVSPIVNKAANDDPRCIEPVTLV